MFSELVDSCIQRSGRIDKKADIIDYANATIRECQSKGLFFKDLVENIIPLTNLDPLIWPIPTPSFRQMRTVQYPDLSYPPLLKPGKVQHNDTTPSSASFELGKQYYYAASNYFVFVRCGTLTSIGSNGFSNTYIGIAYYSWQPRLKYYTVGHRPATFDDAQAQNDLTNPNNNAPGWSFFNLTNDGDPTTTAAIRKDWTNPANQPPNGPPNALTFVTNWLLIDWNEMIKEGTLAKLFKSINDISRANTAYALYNGMREDFLKTELQESVEK